MDERVLLGTPNPGIGFVDPRPGTRPSRPNRNGHRPRVVTTAEAEPARPPTARVQPRDPAFAMNRWSWRVKRLFDVVVSLLALLLLAPVLLVAAVGVKLTSRGPIVFRQSRVGRDSSAFTMYKFRTYPVDHVDDKFSREHDECPLPFGRLLRRTSIDEFPQLFNVLKGDMSIVGPRPERPHFAGPLAERVPDYEDRHRLPGGITGAAQVRGLWGNSSIEERIRLDNHYIDRWTFRGDVSILLRTPVAILRKSRLPDPNGNSGDC